MGKIVPGSWLETCAMKRIIVHWSAGGYQPSDIDAEHYHIMLDGDGAPHPGDHSIGDNLSTADDDYAAHTRGCNTGSIGLTVCGMLGAVQSPFKAGRYPIKLKQWNNLLLAAADLCRAYDIPPDPARLLMHCEVSKFLGVTQAGKWDISVRTWPAGEYEGTRPGRELRDRVKRLLG